MSEELIVLVPVLDRPANVVPLIESFKASGAPGHLKFLATVGDEAEVAALRAQPVAYSVRDDVTWPQKINDGYQRAREEAEWVLFAADDITFHEGWWDATLPYRLFPELNVIGTNDLGNPRVIAGEHSTHPLVRSSYLGTVDDDTSIVHTGYSHWCVDDEFLWTAKIRECWAFCPTAVIEHNHPYWDKGTWDSTYAKGEANSYADMALWKSRAPLLGLEIR